MKRSLSAIFLLFFCLFLLISFEGTSQDPTNLSSADLNSVNIDELSDEQIQKFLDRAQESGLTLQQLELVAKQRGMSSTQIAKLRNRIRQVQLGASDDEGMQIESPSDRLRESAGDEENEFDFFTFLNENDSLVSDKLEIFGMDIFRSGDIAFEPSLNIATPENYVLGAGDEIIIDVYGASEITYQEIISPDGNILISGIGPISLGGITVKEAKNRIFNRLSSIYSGIRGNNPNTFLQVSVGQVRSIKVNVVGNVVQPGTYTLSSFSSAFNALYFSGGPTETGSLRQIEVYRKGKKIAVLDVYKYLFLGDDSQNPQLQDQDVIIVKPYVNRVKLAGNVKQPAIYELKKGEPFSFLLEISGGFSSGAYRKLLTIDRIGIEKREVETILNEEFDRAVINDGDSIYVKKISSRYLNRVQIVGAVDQPGFYELDEELTLAKLIEMAGGVREDAYLMRGNIVRLTSNLRMRNLTFDVSEVINGAQDIVLKADDMVKISSIFELEEDQTVTLIGEVRNTGEYPYIDSMTVEDLINLSGGLTSRATSSKVEVARRLKNSGDLSQSSEIFIFDIAADLSIESGSDFLLKPFDIISIKSSSTIQIQKVIKIEGEVKYPGFYALKTNEDKISDLIDRAGGLTEYGYAEGASLIRRTEYYRTEFEKEELDALLELRRKELEARYANESVSEGSSIPELIQMELSKYEKEITENIKKTQYSNELEARIFRAQQLRKLQQRDSIAGAYDIVEQQGIGIQLKKILNSPDSPEDLILKDGDIISIPRQLETVRVQGEVLYPTTVRYAGSKGFKKYVSGAGGFSNKAKKGKAYIVYANGSAQRTKKFLWFNIYPAVKPGADIIIPQKERKEEIDAREIIALTSAVGTMLLVIDRLSN